MEEIQDLRHQHKSVEQTDPESKNPPGMNTAQGGEQESTTGTPRQTRLIPPEKLFEIAVSEDAMEAQLSFRNIAKDVDAALDAVRQRLDELGIVFGVIDSKSIARHITTEASPEKAFKIAQGKLPTPGKSATVVYHFDTAPLKAGTVNESGSIDYRDRGIIPQVKKQDLLAESSPGIKGTAGTDVYGQPVAPEDPEDMRVIPGRGVAKSDDGMKFYASIDGRPELTPDGRLCVHPDLQIQGDVCFATGHIDFDGNVEVRGTVCEGFRVKAKNLRAEEINHAHVEVEGNIVVLGGIICAEVEAGGTIKAGHIQSSEIMATGNIVVDYDVYESTIETGEKCSVTNGKIITSTLTAKKGIEALDVGSPTAKASSLIFAITSKVRKELSALSPQIEETRTELTHYKEIAVELNEKYRKVDQEAAKAAQEEDRAIKQRRALQEKLKALPNTPQTSDQKVKVTSVINQLNAQITKFHREVERLREEHRNTRTMLDNLDEKISGATADLDEMTLRYESLLNDPDNDNTNTAITVSGTIYANTKLYAPHASTVLTASHEDVIIREVHDPEADDNESEWKIEIMPK